MARTISNIIEWTNAISRENVKTLSYSEELEKINKIKYNLGLLYFAGLTILMTTLFL